MPFYVTPSNTCTGPVGLSIVLPLNNQQIATTWNNCHAVSVCNGTSMHNLWVHDNYHIVATNSITHPTYNSWLSVTGNFSTTPSIIAGQLFTPPKPRPRILPAVIRAGRRAVRRSIDIYARFRGMDEIRRFIAGEAIVFEGELFNYRVQKTLKILHQTMNPHGRHIPYSLRLVDKITDKVLASGCVFFPSLPVIDQLLALSFHLQDSDDERKLLETTNWNPRLPRNWREPALRLAA